MGIEPFFGDDVLVEEPVVCFEDEVDRGSSPQLDRRIKPPMRNDAKVKKVFYMTFSLNVKGRKSKGEFYQTSLSKKCKSFLQ